MEAFAGDVHAAVGLSCHDCHGGNPAPEHAEDMDLAMDPDLADSPYLGAPEPSAVPGFCGRCHSNVEVMRRYRPDARVDQELEYRSSQHGIALAGGDDSVATCVSCHGGHGIRRVDDPDSPVYPTRVAETCRSCHSNPTLMANRTTADGRALPIDQFGKWSRSVHAAALLERSDLSAPTCNDCHGNHGAAPPGLDSIAFVCGQCHRREADLFRASPKHEGLEQHAVFLEDAGTDGCLACHDESEPQASVGGVHALTECDSCHGNHAVIRPTIAMFSPLPAEPCALCHELDSALLEEPESVLSRFASARDEILGEVQTLGLDGERRFDYMVDRLLRLPAHRLGDGEAEGELKPEFAELYRRFRIGKTRFTFPGPDGAIQEGRITRCGDCHAETPMLADSAVGLETAAALSRSSLELSATTATAQRALLRARRGGVETRPALPELEQALDAQIGLSVLVHGFSAAPDSEFMIRQAEGIEHAEAALGHARDALAELAFRRRGLAVALIFVLLLLIALAIKIRQLGVP
jgi:hypothetical protein